MYFNNATLSNSFSLFTSYSVAKHCLSNTIVCVCLVILSAFFISNRALAQTEINCEMLATVSISDNAVINSPCNIDEFDANNNGSFSLKQLSNTSAFTVNQLFRLHTYNFQNDDAAQFTSNGNTQLIFSEVTNNGLITNNAFFNNQASSLITNNSDMVNNSTLQSSGRFRNNGRIFNSIDATINIRKSGIGRPGFENFALLENSGRFIANNPTTNFTGATINNYGSFEANDTLVNEGFFNNSGTFEQESTIDPYLSNLGTIVNNDTMTLISLINQAGADFTNNGRMTINSIRFSIVDNFGLFQNNAIINIAKKSGFTTRGIFVNSGTIDNHGSFTINGTNNLTVGLATNSGLINSSAQNGGRIIVMSGGALRSGGTISNNTIDIESTGLLSAGANGAGTLIFTDGEMRIKGMLETEITSSSIYDMVVGQQNTNVILYDTTDFSFLFSDNYFANDGDIFGFLRASMFTLEGFNDFDEFFTSIRSRVIVSNLAAGFDWSLQLVSDTISLRVFAINNNPSDPNNVNAPSFFIIFVISFIALFYRRNRKILSMY